MMRMRMMMEKAQTVMTSSDFDDLIISEYQLNYYDMILDDIFKEYIILLIDIVYIIHNIDKLQMNNFICHYKNDQ